MNFARLNSPQRLSAISIGIVVLAAFLPWASVLGFSKSGIDGDGIITLIVGLSGGATLALTTGLVGRERAPGKRAKIVLLVLAILVALIGLIDMSGVAAIGLYMTLFAGIAWVVGAVWDLNLGRAQEVASSMSKESGDP